jgi:membrane protein
LIPRSRSTAGEWRAIVKRAGRETLDDHMLLIAKALAFSTFLAIPSALLVVVGVFALVANGSAIDGTVAHLNGHLPVQARDLLSRSLHRLDRDPNAPLVATAVGVVVALGSMTSAMTNYMTALDIAYDRTDRRGVVKRRVVALGMVGCLGVALLSVAGLLIVGRVVADHVGRAVGHERVVADLWSVVRWPIVLLGLLMGFATMLYFGPDVDERGWRLVRPGAFVAVVVWLAASGAVAFYAAHFDFYNKAWGSLSAVIVVLTWLWLAGIALLFGAELDSEVEARAGSENCSTNQRTEVI